MSDDILLTKIEWLTKNVRRMKRHYRAGRLKQAERASLNVYEDSGSIRHDLLDKIQEQWEKRKNDPPTSA